jgi:hypothetical protein
LNRSTSQKEEGIINCIPQRHGSVWETGNGVDRAPGGMRRIPTMTSAIPSAITTAATSTTSTHASSSTPVSTCPTDGAQPRTSSLNNNSPLPTGQTSQDRFSKPRISFAPPTREMQSDQPCHVTSLTLTCARDSTQPRFPERELGVTAAVTGAGLKARRLSISLPDDFRIETTRLYDEYLNPGRFRRRKRIGYGATASVRLMRRRGGAPDALYAVKEFRGKSKTEDAHDYERPPPKHRGDLSTLSPPRPMEPRDGVLQSGRSVGSREPEVSVTPRSPAGPSVSLQAAGAGAALPAQSWHCSSRYQA